MVQQYLNLRGETAAGQLISEAAIVPTTRQPSGVVSWEHRPAKLGNVIGCSKEFGCPNDLGIYFRALE